MGTIHQAVELQKAGKHAQAANIYREILQKTPNHPDANHLLGLAIMHLGDSETALKLINRAIKLQPNTPSYHHNIAGIYGKLGESEQAISHFSMAIRLKPDYGEAYQGLTESQKFSQKEPLISQLNTQLAREEVPDESKCYMHFAAAKILHDVKEFDEAFAHYLKGNALKNAKFDFTRYERLIEHSAEIYDRDFIAKHAQDGLQTNTPVFIVGMPRSGTSLVEQIIASHPDAYGAGELNDISAIASTIPKLLKSDEGFPLCMSEIVPQILQGFGRSYLKKTQQLAPAAQRIVDKHPLNFQFLGLIATMFPQAKIIHTRRDPLDTCLSCFMQNFSNGQEYAFNLEHLGQFYRDYDLLMDHWRTVLPGRMLEVQYEDLVQDQEAMSKKLLAFCELEWDDACVDFHKTDRMVNTASRWQVRQPMYQSSVHKWRNYQEHLKPLIEKLGHLAEASLFAA